MDNEAREIAVAVDQWIREIDIADLEPDEIAVSFQSFCREFEIPEDLARRAVARALA